MIEKLSYCITKSTDPYENLALEEHLLLNVQPGECILYLWQNKNTVVIGRNQNVWAECRVRELEASGGHLARRLSGGGAVYHDLGNLNFTFLVRQADYDVDRQLRVITGAVRAFGLDAQKTGRNDVTIDGRKFSGNAFYRTGDHCYHHGTLLIDVDTAQMSRYLNVSKAKLQSKGVASVRSRVINLRELCASITVDSLSRQLVESFGRVYGLAPTVMDVPDSPEIAARAGHFASSQWKLGANASFTDRCEARFDWGGLELQYSVKNGEISQLALYSDGLEADFLQSLPQFFTGCAYEPSELTARAEDIPTAESLQRQMARDCAKLLLSQIE